MDMITYVRAKKYADKAVATGGNTELIESMVTEEVTKVVAGADADFDTLKEVADWIKNDKTGAAKMQVDIGTLKTDLEHIELTPGPQGPKGDKGDTGAAGKDGAQGPKGADGKTAYKYAQDGGYTGTEEEFASDLHEAMNPVQADWNQNDETAADFIKNRPFYEGEDIEKDILPEVTYNCSTDSGITYIQTTALTLNFKDGVMYDVYINGVVYTLKCNYITEGLIQYTLGDTEFSSAPFHIKYVPMISLFNITFNAQWKESKATVCIKERIKNIKKIERKFVNNIAGMDVEKKIFSIDNVEYTASNGAEIFNDYEHNIATGQYSHAEGTITKAMGLGSHVEGGLTTASDYSHAEGYHTTASGEASHTEGFGTTASGNGSHAEGEHTIARGENQHVQGSCNIEDAENRYAHIVGNGDPSQRSNAHTLDWEGNAWYQGDIYVGSTSGVNRDEGSKKLLTSDDLVQPDWEQNDGKAIDYIKNKPFYDTGEYDFIPVFENGVFGRLSSYVYFGDDLGVDFTLGAFYKIVFNGIDYICEAKKEKQFIYLGNPVGYLETFADIFTTDFSTLDWGTGEPFCIFNGTMVVKDGSSVPKVSIYKRKPIVNMLDRKYIDYIPGENTSLKKIILDGTERICGDGSEVFNDYINNKALGEYSHAEGFNTLSSGAYSHTEAYETVAEGAYSHAEGCQTKAIGLGSHAEGNVAEAKGYSSHAEGQFTTALGNRSHVEGMNTVAIGAVSHVQGKYNLIDDSVPRYTEGTVSYFDWPEYDGEKIVYLLNQDRPKFNNQTGQFTITNEITEISYKDLQKGNLFLFTYPENNTITDYYEIVDFVSSKENGNVTLYKYNYCKCVGHEETGGDNAKLAHIVGNGTKEDARSNAHTLDWDGNAWYAGDVYVGSTSGTNKDEGSKKLATEEQIVGKKTEGTVVTFEDKEYTCGAGAEVFNDLSTNLAIGEHSHAEGSNTVAIGMNAHAEGSRSQAIGNFSHAENASKASGTYAHSEGSQTVAAGNFSHAEGWLSEALAETSHTEGQGTCAAKRGTHVQGTYNEIDMYEGKPYYMPATLGLGTDKTFNSNDIVYVLEDPELNFFTGEFIPSSAKETLVKDLQVNDTFALSNTNIKQYYWLMSIKSSDENQLTGYCVTMIGSPYDNLGKYAHIVGNGGGAHSRSNAHTLDWDGNAWYAGSVECTSFILKSSTEGSNKRFRVTIDDNGELHTEEIVE